MDWENLKFVLALARTGTMSAAARELQVNHSTVSRRVAAFQEHLGLRLFVTTPDGWELTAAGEEMMATAERIEEEVMELDRALLGRDQELAGALRVTALDVSFTWLGPDLVEFSRRYPNIKLELTAQNMPINLTRREADIALRVTNSPPETLVGRRVATVGYAAYVNRSLAESVGGDEGNWTTEQLRRLPWLSWDARMGAAVTENWIRRTVGTEMVRARYDSSPVIIDQTRVGMGAALLPCYLLEPLEEVVRITPVLDGFEIDLWLLTHPDLRRSARVRAFMEFFERAIAARASGLQGPVVE